MKPDIRFVDRYKQELDAISPKFQTMDYPGVVIISGTEVIIFSYTDMDILFNRFLSLVATTKLKNKKKK